MRSNRPNYASSPAGSSKALDRKPRPKKPKKEWNQLLLMVFFIVLPVIGLLAIFLQPARWLLMVLIVAALALMWLVRAFLFPGRMIVSAIYGLVLVFTLVAALSAGGGKKNTPKHTDFLNTTPVPAATSQFASMYNTMGTSVPAEYLNPTSVPSYSQIDYGSEGQKSGAEITLENFMEKWRKGIIADMVAHTPPSWRDAQADSAQQQLFWKFAQRPLIDWRQMSAPSGTDASTARTITVEADVNYGGETRTYQYDAIVLFEDNDWFVDPNSLHSGILVEAATPTPDPNATPVPTPEPTPTPTPGPKTKLYYNKDGGRKYHAEPECYTVSKEYLPLASFTYKQLKDNPYKKLEPCDKCSAPAKP